jgi:hypothetical protein
MNDTVAPLTGLPAASSTSTTSGAGSGWPAIPSWPSPESFWSWVGAWLTSTGTTALAGPAVADTSAEPRPLAVTDPSELTVATAASLVDQVTAAFGRAFPC